MSERFAIFNCMIVAYYRSFIKQFDNIWAFLISALFVKLDKSSLNFRERGIVFRGRVVYNLICIGIASSVGLYPNRSCN